MKNKQHIFVVGPPRSGTSMVAKSLAVQTGGFIVTEVPLITYFANWFSGEVKTTDFRKKVKVFNQFYNQKFDDFKSSLDFQDFYMSYVNHWSKECSAIIDKNPFYAFQIKHVLKCFPDSKVLFVIRDSLATVNSHIENEHKLGTDVCFHAHLWNFFVEEFMKLKEAYPDQLVILKYESFVQNNEKELLRILGSLNLEKLPDEMVLDQEVIKGKDDNTEFVDSLLTKVDETPNEKRIYSWKENLTVLEQMHIASITAKNRELLGYVNKEDLGRASKRGYLKARIKVNKEKLIYYLPIWLKNLILRTK